ncbi:MAG: ABC transporter substrate-binding protein [bacterium]
MSGLDSRVAPRARRAPIRRALAAALVIGTSWGASRAAERPRYGGSLVVVGRDQPAPSLDPLALEGALGGTLSRALYDTLFRVDADRHARPHLVSESASDAEFRVWDLALAPGLAFHDGRSVSASDVAYSLRRFFAAPVAHGGCLPLDGGKPPTVTERGRRAVRVELANGCPTLADMLADPRAAILPAPPVDPTASQPVGGVGTGAFRLVAASATEWVLEANEAARGGRPFLDRVTLRRAEAASDVASGLEIGTIDAVVGAARVADSGSRFRVGGLDTVFLVLARGIAPFDSSDGRRAVAAAIDRQSIADVMLRGRARIARSVLPDTRAGYRALLAAPVPPAPPRPGARDGRAPLALGVARDDSDLDAIAERVQADLQEAGLAMRVVPVDPSEAPARLADGTLAAWITSRTFGDGATPDVLPRFLAALTPAAPAEALAAAAEASRARSIELALRGLLAAERRIAADAVWIPLVHREIGVASGERVGIRAESDVAADGGLWLEDVWQLPALALPPSANTGEGR